MFLAALLYAIAFIGNLGTPTALDGLSKQPFGVALAIDAGLLMVFAVQHSIMPRPWFKERWTRLVPKPIERSTYVLFSSLALIVSSGIPSTSAGSSRLDDADDDAGALGVCAGDHVVHPVCDPV